MNDHSRAVRHRLWLWFPFAVGLMAAVAVSLLAPVSWTGYWRYLTLRFGWQIVAAILTAAVLLLFSMLVAGRRKESGFLALGMFISILIHMMMASMFGGYILQDGAAPSDGDENALAVSSGVPQWTESQLSEEVRSEFTAVTPPDLREMDAGRNDQAGSAAGGFRRFRANPEALQSHDPDPGERVQAVMASAGKAKIEDRLAASGERQAEVERAVVVKLKQGSLPSGARPTQEVPRELPDAEPLRGEDRIPSLDRERPQVAGGMDVQRAPVRTEASVDGSRRMIQREDEILRAVPGRQTIEALDVRAEAMTAEWKEAQRSGRAAPALEAAYQKGEGPDVSAPERAVGEFNPDVSAVSVARLADQAPASGERRVSLEGAAAKVREIRARSGDPAVVLEVALQPLARESGPSVPVAEKTSAVARDVGPGRAGQGMGMVAGPAGSVRAQVSLQGRAAGERKLTGTSSLSGTTSAREWAGVEDRLQAAGRRTTQGAMTAVGGRAEAVASVAGQGMDGISGVSARPIADVKVDKRGMAPEGIDSGSGRVMAGGASMEWALGNAGIGEETGSDAGLDIASVQAVFAPVPEDRQGEAGMPAGRGSSKGLTGFGSVMSADAPVRVSDRATTGTVQSASAGAWQEWGTGEEKAGGSFGSHEAGSAFARQDVEGAFLGVTDPGGSLAGGFERSEVKGLAGGRMFVEEAVAGSAVSVVTREKAGHGTAALAGSMRGITSTDSGAAEAGRVGATGAREAVPMSVGKAASGFPGSADHGKPGGGGKGATEMPVTGTTDRRGVSLADGTGVAIPHRAVRGDGVVPEGALDGRTFGLHGQDQGTAFGTVTKSEAAAGGALAGTGNSGSRTVRAPGDFRVDKAGGGMGGAGSSPRPDWRDVGSAGLSLAGGKSHGRLDGGGAASGVADRIAASGRGSGGAGTARVLITDELSSVPAKVIQKAIYTLRAPERRKEIAREFGGSEKTEQAVESALVWLAQSQSEDGRWDVDGFRTLSRCGGPGDRADEDVALTGLCLLSYLGAGYTHVKGEHKETVRKALNWLIDGQKPDGDLQRDGQMYGQAMATAALCESYSMTGDKRLLGPIERAVAFIARAQNPGAGWRYEPRKDSDTSVTGWQVLALKSAMIAGVRIEPEHFQWVEEWLDAVRRGREGGLYAYMPGQGATPTMTAEGWFCQLMMQEKTRMRGQGETIPYLMEHLPEWSSQENGVNLYFWYYSTLALYMSGAPEFSVWNKALVEALLSGQVQRGPAKGSWDPVCVLGARGGRIYMTATAALCLEVYYRYLPFYKQR